MVGDYVKWNGELAEIIEEMFGYITIRILKTNEVRDVLGVALQPTKFRSVKKRENV